MTRGGRWRAFGVLALIEFLTVMDASIVNIALPSIRDSLGFSIVTVAWIVDGYLIGLAGLMLVAGRITDRVGRRLLFLTGVVVFTGVSFVCAVAAEPWQLVFGRIGQGLGAAMAMPAAIALITDLFPEGPERNRALGIFSGMAGVASPIGLVLGGLLSTVTWRWIFLINLPLGLVAVLAGLRLLPRGQRGDRNRVDLFGAVCLSGGLIALVLAVLRVGAPGSDALPNFVPFAVAAALLGAFAARQIRGRDPLIPPELLRSRPIMIGNAVFVLVGTCLLGTFFIMTVYLQHGRGLDPLAAAVAYLPVPLAMFAGTQLAPRLLRLGASDVLAGALVLQAVALGTWAVLIQPQGNLILGFTFPSTVWALGLGVSIVCSFAVCTSGVPPRVSGAASGLATTSYQGGGAIGLAVLALVADRGASDAVAAAGLTAGYAAALWTACAIAALGAVGARLIARSGRTRIDDGLRMPAG